MKTLATDKKTKEKRVLTAVSGNGMNDIDDIIINEQWDRVLEEISKDKNLIGRLEPYDLAWKRFQYQLADNGKEELIAPFGDFKDLLKIIDKCKEEGIVGLTIPQATAFQQIDQIKKLITQGHNIDPQVINFLFSYQKGWLIYTPIMLFSLIGILLARKRLNDFFGFLIIFMTLNIYILCCWWDWGFGGSFGCRPLIESYAILAFPFALFINWCFSLFLKFSVGKVILRAFLVILLFLLIKLNLFQTWQYKYLIIHWAGMNEKAYKYVFLKEKLTNEQLIYLHNSLVIDFDVEKRKNGIRD